MPAAVELIADLNAVVVSLPVPSPPDDWEFTNATPNLGGRSSVSSPLPARFDTPGAVNGMTSGKPRHSDIEGELRPMIPSIGTALGKALPANERMIEVLGVGTGRQVLGVLINLLKTQGFHGITVFCDGSVRFGFSGPTAVLRGHGGIVPGVFLRKVAAALSTAASHGDDWMSQV